MLSIFCGGRGTKDVHEVVKVGRSGGWLWVVIAYFRYFDGLLARRRPSRLSRLTPTMKPRTVYIGKGDSRLSIASTEGSDESPSSWLLTRLRRSMIAE